MFIPDSHSLIVQPIGGVGMRMHSYQTDDAVDVVTGAGYFAKATSRGIAAFDMIFVSPKEGRFDPYPVVVATIDAEGNATVIVDPGTKLTPMMFGSNVEPGVTDMTEIVRSMHAYANANNLEWTYAGSQPMAIDADAQIVINSSGSMRGLQWVPIDAMVESPAVGTLKTLFVVEDEDTPLVTGTHDISGDAASTKLANSKTLTTSLFSGPGLIYVAGSGGSGPMVAGRHLEDDTLSYRQSFAIDRNGRALHGLSVDFTGWTSIGYRLRANSERGWITIEGMNADPSLFNNQCIVLVQRNEVELRDFAFDLSDATSTPETINRLLRFEDCAYIAQRNIRASAQTHTTSGSYVLSMDNAATIYTERVTGIEGWGVFGTNHVNGWRVSDCNINRVDGHAGLHNVFVTDTTLHDLGVRYGWGGGVLSVTNCHIVNGPAIASRSDYGGYWYGDFIVDGITVASDVFDAIIVDLASSPIGPDTIEAPCPNIYVSNVRRNGRDDNTGGTAQITPVAIAVASTAMGLQAPAIVSVDGVYGTDGWRFAMPIDYANMIDSLLVSGGNHALRVSNVYPTVTITAATQGIYVAANTLVGAGVAVAFYLDHIRLCALTADAMGTDASVFADEVQFVRCIMANNTRLEINGGVLGGAAVFDAETVCVLGGSRTSGNNFTALKGVNVRGAWDLSRVRSMIGVDIGNNSANNLVVLPAGVGRAAAMRGWQSKALYSIQAQHIPDVTLAELATMTASDWTGYLVRVSNAGGGAGQLAYSTGAAWGVISIGAAPS
jgi:hypothetical protein